MAEGSQAIDAIGVALTLDTTQFDARLGAAATKAKAFEAERTRVLRAPQSLDVSPRFAVSQAQVRGLRVDINQHMAAMAARNEAVAVPVKLGRSDWAGMRQEIAQKIGTVPISVSISGGGMGSVRSGGRGGAIHSADPVQVLAAWIAQTQGLSLPNAQTQLIRAARSKGITGRAYGGPVVQDRPYLVGEMGPEIIYPRQAGTVMPRMGGGTVKPISYGPGFAHAYRGKHVQGYGGKFGDTQVRSMNQRTYGDQDAIQSYRDIPRDPGYVYHGTHAMSHRRESAEYPGGDIRRRGRLGSGIATTASNWAGRARAMADAGEMHEGFGMSHEFRNWRGPHGTSPVSFWAHDPRETAGYGAKILRTRLTPDFSEPFGYGSPVDVSRLAEDQQEYAFYVTAQRKRLRDLEYYGYDDRFHKFRRGRSRARGGRGFARRGYGGKYGAARGEGGGGIDHPGEHWFPGSEWPRGYTGETGYVYHGTLDMAAVRGMEKARLGRFPHSGGAGVQPTSENRHIAGYTRGWGGGSTVAGTSYWALSALETGDYGNSVLRTKLTDQFQGPYSYDLSEPGVIAKGPRSQWGKSYFDESDGPPYGTGIPYEMTSGERTIPRSAMQYYGSDDRWHKFRRGRRRDGGGWSPSDPRSRFMHQELSVNDLPPVPEGMMRILRGGRKHKDDEDLNSLIQHRSRRGVFGPGVYAGIDTPAGRDIAFDYARASSYRQYSQAEGQVQSGLVAKNAMAWMGGTTLPGYQPQYERWLRLKAAQARSGGLDDWERQNIDLALEALSGQAAGMGELQFAQQLSFFPNQDMHKMFERAMARRGLHGAVYDHSRTSPIRKSEATTALVWNPSIITPEVFNIKRDKGGPAASYRRFSRMAAANPLSIFGGNMWYQGRRRAALEQADANGWLDRSSFASLRRTAERVIATPSLASPGINDELAMRWSRAILDTIAQQGPPPPGQEDAFVRKLAAERSGAGGLPVGFGYGNFAKAAAVAAGNVWPPEFGKSPKVEPFYHAVRGREHELVADSHHLLAGGYDPNGPASKANAIMRGGVMVGLKPTPERLEMLNASAKVQKEFAHIWPTMRRWQAAIWGEHFPYSTKPQPIENAYTNLIVPKGMRGQVPPGWTMGPNGLLKKRAMGGFTQVAGNAGGSNRFTPGPLAMDLINRSRTQEIEHFLQFDPSRRAGLGLVGIGSGDEGEVDPEALTRPWWREPSESQLRWGRNSHGVERLLNSQGLIGMHNHPSFRKQGGVEAWRPSNADLSTFGMSGELEHWVNTPNYTTKLIRRGTHALDIEDYSMQDMLFEEMRKSGIDPRISDLNAPDVTGNFALWKGFMDRFSKSAGFGWELWRRHNAGSGASRGGPDQMHTPFPMKVGPGGMIDFREGGGFVRDFMSRSAKNYPRAEGIWGPDAPVEPGISRRYLTAKLARSVMGDSLPMRDSTYESPFDHVMPWEGPGPLRLGPTRTLHPRRRELRPFRLGADLGVGEWDEHHERWKREGSYARGGRSTDGTYLVGELNPELFIPDRLQYIIPPDVMDKLPKRDGGGSVRKMGSGVIEVGTRGPHLFQPPEDGWIIPHTLTGRVHPNIPRARDGRRPFRSGYGSDPDPAASVDPSSPGPPRRPRAPGPDLTASADEVARAQDQFIEVMNTQAVGLKGVVQALSGRNAASVLASASSTFLGGRAQSVQNLARFNIAARDLTRFYMANTSTIIEATKAQAAGIRLTREHHEALKGYNDRLTAAADAEKKVTPGLLDLGKNFTSVLAANAVYGIAMTGVSALMDAAAPAVKRWIDTQTGFVATNERVTKSLGEGLRQTGGDLGAVIGGTAGAAGVGAQGLSFLERTLGGSAFAKAGAQAEGEKGDLFKAAAGATAPTGLLGGYGGVFGGPFLAELLGGGKGLAEQIGDNISDLTDAASKRIPKAFTPELPPGTTPPGGPQPSKETAGFQPPQGGITYEVPQSAIDAQKARDAYVVDASESMARGAFDMGEGAFKFQKVVTDSGNIFADAINKNRLAMFGAIDDFTADMAKSGNVLVDQFGIAVTDEAGLMKAMSQLAKGDTIQSLDSWTRQIKRSMVAQKEATSAQTQQQIGTTIPGALAFQLAQSPLLNRRQLATVTGVNRRGVGNRGEIRQSMGEYLDTAQGLKQEARAGEAAMVAQITQYSGPEQAKEFSGYLKTAAGYGREIVALQTRMARIDMAQQAREFAANMILARRALADALGLAGRGGSRFGQLQRQDYFLGRESQSLSMGLQQKQINFQVATAGFTTNGQTAEELAANQTQAKVVASYAQQQLDIERERFAISLQLFNISNERAVADARRSRDLLQASFDNQKQMQAIIREIQVKEMAQTQAMNKAQAIFEGSNRNFASVLGAATERVGKFGGTVEEAIRVINAALNGQVVKIGKAGTKLQGATGLVGMTSGTTEMIVGEAGTEHVAVIRNPKLQSMSMGPVTGGGGSTTLTLNINGPISVRDDSDIAKIAAAVEDRINRRVSLLGLRRPGG